MYLEEMKQNNCSELIRIINKLFEIIEDNNDTTGELQGYVLSII